MNEKCPRNIRAINLLSSPQYNTSVFTGNIQIVNAAKLACRSALNHKLFVQGIIFSSGLPGCNGLHAITNVLYTEFFNVEQSPVEQGSHQLLHSNHVHSTAQGAALTPSVSQEKWLDEP